MVGTTPNPDPPPLIKIPIHFSDRGKILLFQPSVDVKMNGCIEGKVQVGESFD